MADVQAFRGFRYDLAKAGDLSDLIAPPYDVIDASLQQQLYDRSPYNSVRLILNKETASDHEGDNRYTRSAQLLRDWTYEDIITQDSARSIYAYHQDFEVEGKRYTRKGFMARVRLEKFGEGRIYPHEETLSGPKADRLKLFHATQMNLSQIFGLYPDEAGDVNRLLDAAVGRSLPLQATDHLGVVSKLWPISDQHVISQIASVMGPKPLFIADGHHRYETGLRYLHEKTEAGDVTSPDHPANFILMMLVSMQDPGLVILPTHRLVSNVGDLSAEQVRSSLGGSFDFETVGQGPDGAKEAWEQIEMDGSQGLLAFGTVQDGIWQTARFRDARLMDEISQDHSSAWRELGVAILQRVVLERKLAEATHSTPKCQYVHLLREVNEAIAARQCQVAVLVPPATMSHVELIAGNLEKMPPKSTYFYPKLLTGLVFHSLKTN